MVDDLVSRLLEAIAEREQLANATRSPHWRYSAGTPVNEDGSLDCGPALDLGDSVLFADGDEELTEAEAKHVAANDPRAVLALCQAHREVVDEYVRVRDIREELGAKALGGQQFTEEEAEQVPMLDMLLTGLSFAVAALARGYFLTEGGQE